MEQFKTIKDRATRIQLMSDSCARKEEMNYQRKYTADEMQYVKEEFIQVSQQLRSLEDEKKAAMENFKLQIDPVKDRAGELLTKIKFKSEIVDGEVFVFADHENGVMIYVDDNGETVHSRPMLEHERQTNFDFTVNKSKKKASGN